MEDRGQTQHLGLSSPAWRFKVGPGTRLERTHLCAPLGRLLGSLPGPKGTHCQPKAAHRWEFPGREREGLLSWAFAWLGCLELARLRVPPFLLWAVALGTLSCHRA